MKEAKVFQQKSNHLNIHKKQFSTMKKIVLCLLLTVAAFSSFAQSYDKLLLFYTQKKYEDALKELDKVAQDPKAQSNPQTILWRATLYAELANDSVLTIKYPGAAMQAYNYFQQYYNQDTALKAMKENNLVRTLALIYAQTFNEGVTNFKQEKWEDAFHNFKASEELGSLIIEKKLSEQSAGIDTFRVLYAGYAAQNAQKVDSAAYYYEKLVGAQVHGKDFIDVYRFLLTYYTNNKRTEDFNRVLTLAKQYYPEEATLWSQYEMNQLSTNASVDDILQKYKQADATGKLTEAEYIGYAENLASIPHDQLDKLDSTKRNEIRLTSADAYKKAFALSKNGIYAFNVGVLYYNLFTELDDKFYELRGESAALKAKRDSVVKQQHPLADTAIYYLEQAYEILKAKPNREKTENNSLSRSVDFLANLYLWKRDKARGYNTADYNKFDAKYKQFDAEHGKYSSM